MKSVRKKLNMDAVQHQIPNNIHDIIAPVVTLTWSLTLVQIYGAVVVEENR